jgi:hypothetical protein
MAKARLARGAHQVLLSYSGGDLHPGSGGATRPPLGGLLFSLGTDPPAVVDYVDPARARSLCGQRLDWVEALAGGRLRTAGRLDPLAEPTEKIFLSRRKPAPKAK